MPLLWLHQLEVPLYVQKSLYVLGGWDMSLSLGRFEEDLKSNQKPQSPSLAFSIFKNSAYCHVCDLLTLG